MDVKRVFWVGLVAVVLTLFVVFGYYLYGPWSDYNLLEKNSMAQLAFGVGTFVAVVFTVLYATIQFRKAVARPQPKIIFDDTKSSEVSLTLKAGGGRLLPSVSVFNTGNAVSRFYQVQFAIPGKNLPYLVIRGQRVSPSVSSDSDVLLVSFYANGEAEYTCYVNKPVPICSIGLHVERGIPNEFQKPIKIEYKIYGDWGQTENGSLTVRWQEELSHS